jgi:glyoxylate carboligase
MEAYLIVSGDYDDYVVEEIYIGSREGAEERAKVITSNAAALMRQYDIEFDVDDSNTFRVDEVNVTEESDG